MNIKKVNMITVQDWDNLVQKTYNKPYRFQQQEECQSRGIVNISIPCKYTEDDEMNDEIPFEINGSEMGVKFEVWLNADPEQHKEDNDWSDFDISLFWSRNFYPDIYTVANDLFNKGLIEAGDYTINIDW